MKSIQNQYIDLQEGRMTQANFMKNVRQSLPQFISNIVSFKDSVRILKNKGILSESLETACDTCGKPMDENEEGDAIDWYDYQVDDVDSEEIEGGFGAHRPKYTYNAFGTAFGRDIDGTEYKAKFSGKMIKGELDDDSIKIDFDTIELDEAITDNEIYEHVDYESIKSIHHKLADILEKNGKISRSDMLSVAKEFNIDPTSSDFGTIIRKVSELNNPKPAEEEMDESKEQYSPSGINLAYTHFAVKKDDNKIVDAWDYKGVDNEEIKYYSKQDLKDNDYNYPKDIKIVTKSFLERNQIDPFDSKNWFKHKAELNEAKEKQPKEIKGSSGKEQYSKFTEAELDNYQELITGIHTEHICNPDKTYEEIKKVRKKSQNRKKNPKIRYRKNQRNLKKNPKKVPKSQRKSQNHEKVAKSQKKDP